MGIYNRDYYRESRPSGPWGLEITPVVKYLIIANVVVFLLQIFIVREVRSTPLDMMRKFNPKLDQFLSDAEADPEKLEQLKKEYPDLDKLLTERSKKSVFDLFMPPERIPVFQKWLELDTNKVVYEGQIWRLLTHAFCHDRYSVFHILFNMLFLYWFGCEMERMYGSREFLLFYLTAALVAALAFVGLDLYTGSSVPGIGASGAVMAVTMLYTVHFPYETILIFWFIPIQMRWLMVLYVIWDLHPVLLALSGDSFFTGIAHAAHLGGLAFGFCYAWYGWRIEPLVDRVPWPDWHWRRRPRLRLVTADTLRLPAPEAEPDEDQVDRLLQKIYESGQTSLSDAERDLLRQASARLKNRRPG